MIKAVIYDCLGVVISDALQIVCEELARRDPQAAKAVSDIIAANNRGFMEPAESNMQIAAILGCSVDEFRQRIASGEVKDEQLLAYIVDLKKRYKTGMLSNIGRGSLLRRFPDGELERYFDAVVVSAEIGYAKPQREAYLHAAESLGVAPTMCVFTDDRLPFCEAAEATGMKALLYTNFAQFKQDLTALLADTK